MGADLYIEKLYHENCKKYRPLYEKAGERCDKLKTFSDTTVKAIYKAMNYTPNPFGENPHPIVPATKRIAGVQTEQIARYNRWARAVNRLGVLYDKCYSVGYFRDSYNSTSLFWILGLSWWGCKLIRGGSMSVANAKKLLDIIQKKTLPILPTDWPGKNHCEGDAEGWNKYFQNKKINFENFLKQAIEANQPIRCSV